MARWTGADLDHDVSAVLEAAAVWRDRCILGDGSVLSDESLWKLDHVRELERRLVERAIEGTDRTFIEKLQVQLESAEEEIQHLAAEVYWFYSLFPSRKDLLPRTKRRNVGQIWEWSGSTAPESEHLTDVALIGVARTGVQYKTGIWDQIKFLLRVVSRWKEQSHDVRMSPRFDSLGFADWLDQIADAESHPMRHVFLYLQSPDFFERIVSGRTKRKIVTAFQSKLPKDLTPVGKDAPLAHIDRALYELRRQFEEEYRTSELDFFRSPLKERWDETAGLAAPTSGRQPPALNTILYGPPGTGKTYTTAQRCVEICDGATEPNSNVRERYEDLVQKGRVEFATFHQTYGYEEFVEGLRPESETRSEGAGHSAGFRVVPTDGILKQIAGRARDSGLNHVLVIDEINRANVSKVMGEVITLLEEDKRQGAQNEVRITLPHSREHFTLPPNLHIVGTMNTADRSIALLDTALRRRFEFEELAPDPKLLEDAAKVTGIDLPQVLRAINERLEWLIDRDHLLGHAWLMAAKTKGDVDRTMRRKIIPLIAEYFYDDWERVRSVLGGTDDFVKRTRLAVPPGLEDSLGDEARYRWEINEEFPEDAYTHLIGRSAQSGDSEST